MSLVVPARTTPVKFGKLAPQLSYTTPRLATYLADTIAPPPAAFDILPRVFTATKRSDIPGLFPIDGNNSLGDCTIAALAHAQTVYRAMAGSLCILGAADVEKLYFQLTGGPDVGLAEINVLNYWRTHPVNNDRILGFASIDPHNHIHVQQAIALFGGVYIGFQVTQQTIQQWMEHTPWTPAPLIPEGHAVFVTSFNATGVVVLTWGSIQQGTWAWWDQTVDECYAIVPPEAFHPQFAPGVNVPQLMADMKELAA